MCVIEVLVAYCSWLTGRMGGCWGYGEVLCIHLQFTGHLHYLPHIQTNMESCYFETNLKPWAWNHLLASDRLCANQWLMSQWLSPCFTKQIHEIIWRQRSCTAMPELLHVLPFRMLKNQQKKNNRKSRFLLPCLKAHRTFLGRRSRSVFSLLGLCFLTHFFFLSVTLDTSPSPSCQFRCLPPSLFGASVYI